MEVPQKFITFGYIIKDDNFKTLEDNIINNTLVFEEIKPYPGYHGDDLPQFDNKPGHIFFVTKTKVSFEKLHRIYKSVRKNFAYDFIMDMGEFKIKNQEYPFLRVKKLKDYLSISLIQKLINNEDIVFEKSKKITDNVIVKIDKYFALGKLNDFVYNDLENEKIFYLDINQKLEWDKFIKITDNVRNNLVSFPTFDSAIGVLYFKEGLVDTVRVYCDKFSADMLLQIRNKYVEAIARFEK